MSSCALWHSVGVIESRSDSPFGSVNCAVLDPSPSVTTGTLPIQGVAVAAVARAWAAERMASRGSPAWSQSVARSKKMLSPAMRPSTNVVMFVNGTRNAPLRQLAAAAAGRLQWALGDMSRQNLISLTGHVPEEDANHWLMPYANAPDAALAARYAALAELPVGSLGRTFSDFYTSRNFEVRRRSESVEPAVRDAARHHPHPERIQHITPRRTPRLDVHRRDAPVRTHVRAHLAGVVQLAPRHPHQRRRRRLQGALDPEKFWVAWTRGSSVCVDVFDPTWDFWSTVEEPVADLRARYEAPPLDPALAAEDRTPDWYEPIA